MNLLGYKRGLLIVVIIISLGLLAVIFCKNYFNRKVNSFEECIKQKGYQSNLMYPPTCITKDGRQFVQRDNFSNGWYWGSLNQKLAGTPDDWIYQEAGRGSCWHKPGVECL